MLFNIHFQKWSKVTVEDNDDTICTKIYKGSGNKIKNLKILGQYSWPWLGLSSIWTHNVKLSFKSSSSSNCLYTSIWFTDLQVAN